MSWDDIMNSDLNFKVNSLRHVVELQGVEVGLPTSTILLYFNRISGKVNVAVFTFNTLQYDLNVQGLEDYYINSTIETGDDGTPFSEITCVSQKIVSILENS